MSGLFKGKASFNGDISKWDVSSVTNMVSMFHGATEFNGDISEWDVSSVTKMRFMFYKATKFNQDLSKWASKILSSVSRTNMFTRSGLEKNKPSWW